MIDNGAVINIFNFRHACKVFDTEKSISKEDFATILEAGRLSPSSFGFEPWKFLVIQNMQLREKLMPVTWGAQRMLPTASHFIVILARRQNTMKYDSDYITHIMYDIHHLPKETAEKRRSVYTTFQKNDLKLLENERATFDWSCKQTYIALGNMMTAAAMLGIDSCAVEGFQSDGVEKVIKENFAVDTAEFGVSAMAAFGYRINEPRAKTRQSMNDVVQWYI